MRTKRSGAEQFAKRAIKLKTLQITMIYAGTIAKRSVKPKQASENTAVLQVGAQKVAKHIVKRTRISENSVNHRSRRGTSGKT